MSALHMSTGGHSLTGSNPAVLIHGAGGNRTQWATQARHLAARGCDVLAVDLPGHGRSSGPPCRTVADYADAVLAELDARDVATFTVAGHSMGALIALHMAATTPARVTHLALIGAGVSLSVTPALLDATDAAPAKATDAIIDWGHSASSHIGSGQSPGIWMDGHDLAVLRAEITNHPGALHADFSATAAYNGTEDTAAVTAQTLVISGEHDRMAPPALGRALAEAIDRAHYLEVAQAGHMLMTERPAQVSKALAALFVA